MDSSASAAMNAAEYGPLYSRPGTGQRGHACDPMAVGQYLFVERDLSVARRPSSVRMKPVSTNRATLSQVRSDLEFWSGLRNYRSTLSPHEGDSFGAGEDLGHPRNLLTGNLFS